MIIAVRGAIFSLTGLRLHITATALEREMSQSVADVLVSTLEQIGVRHIFGPIGDSLNPLADAVRRSKIEWVGVRHEEGAALAASGQAKFTGRLAVCAGTTGPVSSRLVLILLSRLLDIQSTPSLLDSASIWTALSEICGSNN
jgi:glyoxylate carboligase